MRITRGTVWLLAPALAAFLVLLIAPLFNMSLESFKLFIPGRVGTVEDAPFTVGNYAELLKPAYVFYFLGTFRIGLVATGIGLLIGYPIAYFVARQRSSRVRKLSIAFLISMLFLSILVRVYSLALVFGSVGILRVVARFLDISPNSGVLTEVMVIAGLLHVIVPMIALTLIGTIQNVNPRLAEAAQALGAARWKAILSIDVVLSLPGIISAFLIAFTLCISAFVIPMILGQGRVLFVSNLIYNRFSEVANYPSGAAISVVMLLLSLVIVYGLVRIVAPRWEAT